MIKNRFGHLFSITTWGESHGPAIGVVIDGCPAGLFILPEDFEPAMARRAPGRAGTSPRREGDTVTILSGVYQNHTTGAPIALNIRNENADPSAYTTSLNCYRPGHAQYAYERKYGIADPLGGGRASARETACRVAAGVIAGKILAHYDIYTLAFLSTIGSLSIEGYPSFSPELAKTIYTSPYFSLLPEEAVTSLLASLKEEKDSCGGVVSFITSPIHPGLGEPIFGKLPAYLSAACMSIPAAKGFEIGRGFNAAEARGSWFTDPIDKKGMVSNHCGGTLGGVTIGMPIEGRVTFKPTSSIQRPCATITREGCPTTYTTPNHGRHDPSVAIRAVPVVEAMLNLVLVDLLLYQRCAIL